MTKLDVNEIQKGIGRMQYRGVGVLKFPIDYVLYQMIIWEVKPDLIIEIGTYGGGNALYMADLLETFGIENGMVHTIDLWPELKPEMSCGSNLVIDHPRIKYFNKGYQGYDIAENTKGKQKILIIDDASHKYTDILAALNKFHHLIPKDSYYIIEDGNLYQLYPHPSQNVWDGGPLRAIDEFLKTNNDFFIDRKWCDYYGQDSTFNTNGYLKKK